MGENSSSAGSLKLTSEIIQFLKDGEKAIRVSSEKDVVLVLGITGSGKSTLTQFVTNNDEHMVAVEQGLDTGEFIIRDNGNKVCPTTVESCTSIPDLIVDRNTLTPYYDNPGFGDTRHVKHDLSITYFIKKVVHSAEAVKLVFVVSYPAVRVGVDRRNFMLLVHNAVSMIKDVEKFKDSIALIVTKVDNRYIKKKGIVQIVSDQSIIKNIIAFLEEVKNNLIGKRADGSSEPYLENAIKFIDILLTKKEDDYPRIGIFRRPDGEGQLTTPLMLENKGKLRELIADNLKFTYCDSDDFGYTVSAESKNRLHEMIEQLNKIIGSEVETIAEDFEEGLSLEERDISDVGNLHQKFHFGYEALQNINPNVGDPSEFLSKIGQIASKLKIDLPKESVDNILYCDRFLKFIHTVSGLPPFKPLEWTEGLSHVVHSVEESRNWYNFLINLQTTLLRHDVQIHLSENSTIIDNLREQITVFNNDDSVIKENLKQFLARVYKDGSEKEHSSIKNAKLNSWKLRFLKDMIDFQVLTLCLDNKLVVIGNYVHLSDVERKRCDGVKFVEIFALSKLFIDADYDRTGSKIQLSVLAPTWEVIGSHRIVLDGKPGENQMVKASDGQGSGANGHNGEPGLPGGAAGNFLGFGSNCINCQFLTVSACGGKGGKGQDGGDGAIGKSGSRPTKPNRSKNIFNVLLVRVAHEDKGSEGDNGGDGGMGGAGGLGGENGKVSIVLFDTPEENVPKAMENEGSTGDRGNVGKGGAGGLSEHLIESNTYVLGFISWSNGWVTHLLYPSPEGMSYEQLNHENQRHPEPSVDLENPSFAINHYKAYLRENLNSSVSRLSLEKFLSNLETSKEVREHYDTLGLVNDLKCLENQYVKLHHHVPLLPFYESLLGKIEAFARDPPFNEISGEYRKVRAFLYMSALSKICSINNNQNNDLVINVKDFFSTVVRDVDQLLKDFMVAKQRNERRASFKDKMNSKIVEANNFIKNDISVEAQRILAELDEQIRALVLETQRLQNITRKELKTLNEHMISKGISKIVRLASKALDFFGLLGLAAEGVVESTNLISEALSLSDDVSTGSNIFGSLPRIVDDFFSSISDHFKERIELFVTQLFDVDKIFRDFQGGEVSALKETRSVIANAREEFSETFDNPEDNVEKAVGKRNELIVFIQDQKKAMEKLLEGDPKLEKALDVLDHAEQILKLPEGVYNMLKKSKIEESRNGDLDANEKLARLERYEHNIYTVIIPLCKNLKAQFDGLSAFNEKSQAALDVGKWKVQNALNDINAQILHMTEGFEVNDAISRVVDKLKFGVSTMIQVYDRIQDYRHQVTLAEYMAEIASEKANSIQITDRNLSDAIDDLQVILKTNLILADYEMAMNAFGQHVFPFAEAYMKEYDVPPSLKFENSTGDLLTGAIYKINSIDRKLTKNELTINKNVDGHFFPDISFSSGSAFGPFYEWTYETSSYEIQQLLRGEAVVLHADVKGLAHNAIKFNEIGIRFKLSNQASQVNFDNRMKNFFIDMSHFGMSYYRCGRRFYVMTHDQVNISHSVNENVYGEFYDHNNAYHKITKNEPLLSPYTMWTVKLHNTSREGFEILSNFTNEIIDLELVGHGTLVSRDIDQSVCSDHLDRYYKVDRTIKEVHLFDVGIDNATDDAINPGSRRRRSVGENGVFSPLKRLVQWFTGKDELNDFGDQLADEVDYDGLNSVPLDPVGPALAYIDNSDNSHSLNRVNYGLVASQNNLVLLDVLMRRLTGAKRLVSVQNDVIDDEYAHNLAYRAHIPQKD